MHAISPDEHDKPQVPDLYFSISHSYPYVACIISTKSSVGIDIQCWHKNILALQHKFLAPAEQQYCGDDAQKITLAWSSKEAAYKYQGRRGVDFIEHLPIQSWEQQGSLFKITINLQLLQPHVLLSTNAFIFPDFALAFSI